MQTLYSLCSHEEGVPLHKIEMMRKVLILQILALMITGCDRVAKNEPTFYLHGAWTLNHVEYPSGGGRDYSVKGDGTSCMIYDGDSVLYECRMTSTPSGLVMMPMAKIPVTLLNKGGGEWLYLENGNPHPINFCDSAITIQRNGILYSSVQADDIYQEWGDEICRIIDHDLGNEDAQNLNRYVLSAKERQQKRTIHGFWIFSVFIIVVALMLFHIAITNRRAKRQLQLRLQQILEEHTGRAQPIRQAMMAEEDRFLASDDYSALQKRMASGLLMKEEEWQQVEQLLKTIYPGFTSQLRSLYPMSELEYQTCLLIKLRIAPKDIAAVLARDASTISTVRSRLYKKVFGRKGGTKEWDDFILSIGA